MPSTLALLAALLTIVGLSAAAAVWARRKALARLRREWGRGPTRARPLAAIAAYFESAPPPADRGQYVDDRTWNDLDMDAVFGRLDHTQSTLGQQVLYRRLRNAPIAPGLEAFEAMVTRMTQDLVSRERAQLALSHLQSPGGYDLWWLAQPDAIVRRPWHAIFPVLSATMLFALVLIPFHPAALLVLIVGAVVNLIIRAAAAPRVASLVGPFRQLSAVIGVGERLLFLEQGPGGSLLGDLRRDLASLRGLKRILRIVTPDPLAVGELLSAVVEYLNLLLLLDVNAVYLAAGALRRNAPALLRVISAVGEVDAAISTASVRAGHDRWTRPVFVPAGSAASMADLRHPLLEDAVPNSVALGPPHGVLITGSNMAGKTTFVRTVGVNAILAQSINTCFASQYSAPVLRVRSCIGRSDDLLSGKSYYLAEVEAVLGLVHAATRSEPHLFLFDELFRGTNAIERVAAAEAVLRELIGGGPTPHYVLAATHDGELVDYLADLYSAVHFGDQLGPEGLMFDHQLRPGVTPTRNAIALLRLYGASPSLVSCAEQRAALLDRERTRQLEADH